jgi:hypothetical protein
MGLFKKKADGEGKEPKPKKAKKEPKPKKQKPKKEPKPKKQKAPKKPKPKKEPKAKKLKKEPKPVELDENGEPIKKGKKKLFLFLPVILVVIIGAGLFFLGDKLPFDLPFNLPFIGGGSGSSLEEPEPEPEPIVAPVLYTMGESTIPALPVYSESILVYEEEVVEEVEEEEEASDEEAETSTASASKLSAKADESAASSEEGSDEEASSDEEEAEEEEEEPSVAVAYRYEGLSDPLELVSAYTAFLTATDVGFSTVDSDYERIDAPDFAEAEPEGSIVVAMNAPEDGKALSVKLDWTEENVIVTLDLADGKVHDPPLSTAGVAYASGATMTLTEAVDYMRSLQPSALGLDGASMDEYNIYVLDGAVLVNGNPCIPLNIYRNDGTVASNQIAGSYLLANDASHVYRLDNLTHTVTEVG